jgi:hypothetical protein
MLLITNFLELRWQIANMPSPCHASTMALRSRFQKGIYVAWLGIGRGTALYV